MGMIVFLRLIRLFRAPPPDVCVKDIPFTDSELLGEKHWYRWNIKNWGTKWDCYQVEYIEMKNVCSTNQIFSNLDIDDISSLKIKHRKNVCCLTFRFETAWSTPSPVFSKLSGLFDVVLFVTSVCEGRNFVTDFVYSKGKEKIYKDYTNTDEELSVFCKAWGFDEYKYRKQIEEYEKEEKENQ